jgi:putative oligomerization/nucleic acid binding protein
MVRIGRWVAGTGGVVVLLLLGGVGPAYAAGTWQQCMNQAVNHHGEPPVCSQQNGGWVPSWPGDAGASGSGIPSGFIVLFVLAALIGVGVTIWKVTTAQTLAKRSGMDPGLATQMTLLTDDGLDATYLAASLRQPPRAPAGPSPESASAAMRLTELKSLLDQGLISSAEYDERRKQIIDNV